MKKNINKIDALADALAKEFSKIPNFDLMRTDELGNKLFNIITFRIAEVTSYKELVCQHFFPATNKAIFESKKEFQTSQYKKILTMNDIDFQETLYDTVRLAYVGLFHKLENYINDVVKIPELVYPELLENKTSVSEWANEKFQFKIKNWRQFYITHKINWICNCVKHKDSLPIIDPRPMGYESLDPTQRIRIKPDEFKKDCENLIQLYPIYLQTMFIFTQHKLAMEKPLIEDDWKHSLDLYEKQIENLKKMEETVQDYVCLLRKMK